MDLPVFLLSFFTELGGFSLIDHFYIIFIISIELEAHYSKIWFFLLPFFIYKQEIFLYHKTTCLIELMPKKNKCNIVVTWLHHVILLVIIFNNFLLSSQVELANFLCTNLFLRDDNFILYYYQLSSYHLLIY